jgi:hypothetical protein
MILRPVAVLLFQFEHLLLWHTDNMPDGSLEPLKRHEGVIVSCATAFHVLSFHEQLACSKALSESGNSANPKRPSVCHTQQYSTDYVIHVNIQTA